MDKKVNMVLQKSTTGGEMKSGLHSEKGGAAVEFAIIMWVLLVLIFGIIEFGLILYDKAVITNASREGARAGIVARYDPAGEGAYNPLTDDEIRGVVTNYCGNHLVTFGSPTSVVIDVTRMDKDNNGTISSGDELTVTVTYNYGFLVLPNLVTEIIGPMNLTGRTVMRME